MWFNLFAPQGEDQVCEFPPDCGSLCWRLGLWRDCISASPSHFDVGFFFSPFPCVGVTQLVLGLFSEQIFPYVTADLACSCEEVSSGSFYITILNWAFYSGLKDSGVWRENGSDHMKTQRRRGSLWEIKDGADSLTSLPLRDGVCLFPLPMPLGLTKHEEMTLSYFWTYPLRRPPVLILTS